MPEYLISFNDEWVPAHTEEQLTAKARAIHPVMQDLEDQGALLFGGGALDRSTVLGSVTAVEGEPIFTDGPFVESKEHLGGFAVIEVADDDAARSWAGRMAVALEIQRFPARHPASLAPDDRAGATTEPSTSTSTSKES